MTQQQFREQPVENFMVKINGKAFRCECGCNVFHKEFPLEEPNHYTCNACNRVYEGT